MFVPGISARCPVKETKSNRENLDNDRFRGAKPGRSKPGTAWTSAQ
jgi:hypothetical protein